MDKVIINITEQLEKLKKLDESTLSIINNMARHCHYSLSIITNTTEKIKLEEEVSNSAESLSVIHDNAKWLLSFASNVIQLSNVSTPLERENVFIVKLRKLILEEIKNPNLNGNYIGKKMGMSRMQLHRKIKALTNQSIGEYVREIRLQQAYDLLKERGGNVSEVAYLVGFSSANYFSIAFKKRFSIPPSNVLKIGK